MNIKKVSVAFTLAMLLSFNISPMIYSAPTPAPKKLTLEYKDGTRVATIIRGSTINIRALNTVNYGLRTGQPLKVTDGINSDSKDQFNVRVIDDKDPEHEFVVEAIKPTPPKPTDPQKDPYPPRNQYVIQSNYNSMQRVASAYCPGMGFSGTLEALGEPLAIIRNSVATLEFDGSMFKLKDVDKDDAGIFKNWKEYVTVKSIKGGTSEKDPLIYELHFKNENSQDYFFNFYPNQRHKVYADHDNNPITPPIWDGKSYTYELKESTYTIQFIYEESNQLMLSVEHPRNVLEDVVNRATNANQGKDSPFVRMKGSDDDFQYITDNMELRGIYEMYGEKLDLAWEWIPENAADSDVIKISGPSEWKNASVQRKREDVKGKLQVTASYRTPGFYSPTDNDLNPIKIQGAIDVLIYGRGISADVTQRSQKIGRDPETAFASDKIKLPSNKYMDMYKGDVDDFTLPTNPYLYTLSVNFGEENGYAHTMVVKSSNPDVVSASIEHGDNSLQYVFGSTYTNKYAETLTPTSANFVLAAKTVGTAKLEFQFFIKGNNNKLVEDIAARKTLIVEVEDSSPNDDSTLSSLTIKQPGQDIIEFGFKPSVGEYDVEVGYPVSEIVVKPTRNDPNAKEIIEVSVFKKKEETGIFMQESKEDVKSGSYSPTITLVENNPTRIMIKVTAENPHISKVYRINIMRIPPSTESGLKTLQLFDIDGKNLMPSFDTKTKEYFLTVPYSTKMLRPVFTANHSGTKADVIKPELVSLGIFQKAEWAPLTYSVTETSFVDTTTIEIRSRSESDIKYPDNPINNTTYKVHVKRDTPSSIATLDSMDVLDKNDKKLAYLPSFNKELDMYDMSLPYSTGQVVIAPKATSKYASIAAYDKDGNKLCDITNGARSQKINIPYITDTMFFYDLIIRVTAENETTTKDYTLRITREAPNDNALLKSLIINDQDKKGIDIEFHQENYNYTKEVTYETEKVTVIPTAFFDYVESIKVNNRKVENGKASNEIKLNYPEPTVITVEVAAENKKDTRTYTITLTRQAPSNDARLKGLVLSNTEDFKPLFIASKTEYSAVVTSGAKGINITATANHPGAKIYIDGTRVDSGIASQLIEFITVDSTVKIVVTAQDGKTTMTYNVKIKNPNLIEKSSNADLRNLTINYGEMTPSFKASISSYEVAVRDDVFSVDILPRPADSLAKVRVFSGTKEIGDENGNFAEAIVDGENTFLIQVTSPDKTKTKEYEINVYKKEDDKMGVLTPITADQIDYLKSDLIIVDISKYSRVSADVFNTLKKYPNKTMILIGNDYSFEFKASDIKKVIPNTTIYDFGLKFSSPNEDRIYDLVYSSNLNYYDDLTIVHFNHHGELPAPAKFTLSLGNMYKNKRLFWNYYNEERDRMDYYGYVNTNTKGTFSLVLNHMSDYVVTTVPIKGAENKAPTNQNINHPSTGKANPNTGMN